MHWANSWKPTQAAVALILLLGCNTVPNRRTAQSEKLFKPAPSAKSSSEEISAKDQRSLPRADDHADRIPRAEPPIDREVIARRVSLSPQLTPGADRRNEKDAVRDEADSSKSKLKQAAMERDENATFGEGFLVASSTADSDVADEPEAAIPPAPQSFDAEQEDIEQLPPAYPLDLGNVLFLADAQNPNVGFARERINEAYARVDRSEALWLPSIRGGMNYFHHEGNVQDVVGNVFSTNKSAFYGGLGAGGAGSVSPTVPGVVAQFHFTDAIFQPKIAGHQAASREFGATATRNDILRNSAVAYLELVRAEQALAIAEEAYKNTKELADLTGEYARTGQGLRSDHERMLAELALRESELAARVEGIRVASARLAQLLHADPSVRITSGEPMVVPLNLLETDCPSGSLVATGLSRRPELAEQKHLVCEAVERLQREKFAPLVPSVLLGLSYGGLGGGLGNQISNTAGRWDTDAMAFWEIRNFGLGERAARDEMSSLVRQAQQRELALLDQVAREVVEAHAQVIERERRINASRTGITAAERSFQLNENRIENAQGLPIESLQAVQALAIARQTYLNAVVDYNVAQFELCRAIGWFDPDSDSMHQPE